MQRKQRQEHKPGPALFACAGNRSGLTGQVRPAHVYIYIRTMQAPTRATPALASYERATLIYASSEALISVRCSHAGAATLRSFVTRPTGGRVIFLGQAKLAAARQARSNICSGKPQAHQPKRRSHSNIRSNTASRKANKRTAFQPFDKEDTTMN